MSILPKLNNIRNNLHLIIQWRNNMNYNEALQFIHESHKFGMRLGLDNIKKLLELLGNPQKNLNI